MEILEKLNLKTRFEYEKFRDVYLVSLFAKDVPFTSFGKGYTLDSALTSAYGEMSERILTKNYLEEYYIPRLHKDAMITPHFLNSKLKDFYQTDKLQKEDLIDFNSDIFDILSIPFTNPKTGEIVYFPINIVQNLYASNGMAYHPDIKQAYYNAKTEIIERFVKFEVIKYALPLPKITHPLNSDFIQVYDATLDGRYPVMAVSFIMENEIILSFGCDLNKEVAIKKAYLELMQTKLKKRGMFVDSIEEVRSDINLINHFIDLSGDIHINFLKKPYFKKGKWNFKNLDVFNADEYIKITNNAIQVIIPSISEVYPITDLAYNNINRGKFIRSDVLNLKNQDKVIDYLYEHGAWDIGSFIGVKFEKNYTTAQIFELYEDGYKYSKEYENILKLAKALNEI
ncbi:MAG: hypothetical protein GXO62_00160 [Epsilonproteobacteria bacterium]|nr:hypothetical protein [Campylobacterota bacterium]